MNIRLASINDAETISALIYALTEKYVVAEFPAHSANALLASMLPEGIRKQMHTGCRYHVAELDGQVIGVIGMKDNKHLYHLFVAEAQHRKGIARSLWQTAMTTCRSAGYTGGFTVNSSRHTQAVYEQFGFVAQSVSRKRDGVISIPMVLTPAH